MLMSGNKLDPLEVCPTIDLISRSPETLPYHRVELVR